MKFAALKIFLLSCSVLGVSARSQPRGAKLSSGIRGERRRRLQDMDNVGSVDDKDKEGVGELDDDDALSNGAMGNMTGANATMSNMTGVLDEVMLAAEELISVEEEDDKDGSKEDKADKADKEDKADKDDKDEEDEVDSEDESAEAVEADSMEEVNSMEDVDPEYDD